MGKQETATQENKYPLKVLRLWRQRLVQNILRALTILGFLALVVASYSEYLRGYRWNILLYLGIYTVLLYLIFALTKSHALAFHLEADITERKRAEEALKESEKRYRRITSAITDYIYTVTVVDGKAVRTLHSPASEAITGYTTEEFSSDPNLWFNMVVEDDRERVRDHVARILAGEDVDPIQHRIRRKDGSVHRVSNTPVLHMDSCGVLISYDGVISDITERNRVEKALMESQERYRILAENAHDLIWIFNLNLECIYVSPSVKHFRGYSVEEAMHQRLEEVLTPDSYRKAMQLFESEVYLERSGQRHGPDWSQTHEFEVVRKDGSTVWTEVTMNLISNDDGEISGLMGITRDISERKRAETALLVSEEKYRLLVENANEAIFVAQDGMLRFVNPKTVEILGYTNEELTSNSFVIFLHPEDRALVVDRHQKRLRGEMLPEVYSFRIVDKAGNTRWVEINAVLISWEGRPATLNFLADITQRIQAVEALKERQAKLNSIFRAAPTGIGVVANRILLEVNDHICDITGYAREELVGKSARILYPTQEDFDFVGREKYRQIQERGTGSVETRWRRKDGTIIDIILSSSPIVADDLSAGVTFTVLDITERKQAEAALRQKLAFDSLITKLLAQFASSTGQEIDEHIRACLQEIGCFVGAEDVFVILASHDFATWKTSHDWQAPGTPDLFQKYHNVPMGAFVWSEKRLQAGDVILVNTLDDLPPEAAFERENLELDGAKSVLQVPLRGRGGLVNGCIGLKSYSRQISWSQEDVQRLQIVGDTIANALERKRAEAALMESEERYRILAENVHDIIFTMDVNLRFTYISPSITRIRGFTVEEAMSQTAAEALTPASLEVAMKAFLEELEIEARETKDLWRTRTMELEETCKDGSPIWTETSFSTLRDEENKFIGFLGITRDITERKRAEETLKESEQKLDCIIQGYPIPAFVIDKDHRVVQWNKALEELSKIRAEDVRGTRQHWRAFYPKERPCMADLVLNQTWEGIFAWYPDKAMKSTLIPEAYEAMDFFPELGGEGKWLRFTAAAIKDSAGNLVGAIETLEDVTENKRAEAALKESEERFRDLARLLPETVFEANEKGVFTFVNQAGFEKFRFTQEDFDRGLSVLDVIVPEEHPRLLVNVQRIIQGERIGLNEYTARRKDGIKFPALAHSTRILREGNPAGLRGFLIDISEKKALEEQLMRAQKMEAIGTLAGGIAHDFNNLLMGILGNVSLMKMKMDESHPFHERMKNLEDYVQRGSDLTKQLLGFARGGKYEIKPTHLGEFIRKSSEMFGRTKKEIRIHRKAQEKLWTVEVDRGQMDQVFLNLYVNAWQAMPGGGDLYLSVENMELNERAVNPCELKPGRYVKVMVADTGIGMDEVTKARIFEPFFTTKELGRGTGLGLATVYGIVQNHGGFIHVESEKGVGSTFIIYLPASEKAVEDEKKAEDEVRRGRETILLIDDEAMILDVGSRMLIGLGYAVLTAQGGKTGVEVFRQNFGRIGLVILDVIMPDIGGWGAFERLQEIDPSVKVLLSSGYALDEQAKEIMAKGCKGFIQKPFSMEELSKKIREILDKQ